MKKINYEESLAVSIKRLIIMSINTSFERARNWKVAAEERNELHNEQSTAN